VIKKLFERKGEQYAWNEQGAIKRVSVKRGVLLNQGLQAEVYFGEERVDTCGVEFLPKSGRMYDY